jgi:hypothetical protein
VTLAGVELAGLSDLTDRLAHARAGVLDLTDVNRDAAQLVATEADPTAPRKTGRLASSTTIVATADSWGLANGQPYFLPVHWGTRYMRAQPWLQTAADTTTDRWQQLLADHLQQLLD